MKTIDNHDAKIFTDNIENVALEQIQQLLSIGTFSGCKIRIMPDVHAGAGCVIGFTGNLGDKIIPNIVGVDIGCGIYVQPFACVKDIDFHAFNEYILNNIPSGRDVRGENNDAILPHKYMDRYIEAKGLTQQLRCYRELKDAKRLSKSIGSLGGGNHFIEVDKDESGLFYLLIHTGSRNLGKQVADLYQKTAIKNHCGWDEIVERQTKLIEEYKQAGRRNEIQSAIAEMHRAYKARKPDVPEALCYLEGHYCDDYLNDMRLCQQWAKINRRLIANLLIDFLLEQGCIEENTLEPFESVHNYIGNDNIIRKGAISARAGEKCIIPLNMRDGALICIGKGNEDWNYSAPHGAGRVMSRAKAFKEVSMDEFKQSMEGIYSETIMEGTKDESPMVYKPMDEIIENIHDTVTIVNNIKPIFNFKAPEWSSARKKDKPEQKPISDDNI